MNRSIKILFAFAFAFAFITFSSQTLNAQTADEIINSYFENTGGYDSWGTIKGVKMTAKVNQGGMEIPIEIVQMADGRSYSKVTFQGMTIMQGVYDGTTSWGTNFQTMKAEKSDEETSKNRALDSNDFPDALYDYKKKGYTVELLGTEMMEGTEAFKLKLIKEPRIIDGEKVEDISFYYFDSEAFVPIAQESEVKQGPNKGVIQMVTMSDYQEVDGFYFPFSITQGVKGSPGQPVTMDSIELNPEVEDSAFAYPEGGE